MKSITGINRQEMGKSVVWGQSEYFWFNPCPEHFGTLMGKVSNLHFSSPLMFLSGNLAEKYLLQPSVPPSSKFVMQQEYDGRKDGRMQGGTVIISLVQCWGNWGQRYGIKL